MGSSVVVKTFKKVFSGAFEESKLAGSNPGCWANKLDFFVKEKRLLCCSSSLLISLGASFWNEKLGLLDELELNSEFPDEEKRLLVDWAIALSSVFFKGRKGFSAAALNKPPEA